MRLHRNKAPPKISSDGGVFISNNEPRANHTLPIKLEMEKSEICEVFRGYFQSKKCTILKKNILKDIVQAVNAQNPENFIFCNNFIENSIAE